ncbi:hypothetical protein PSTT_11577, partial [Puccinia striiformis]
VAHFPSTNTMIKDPYSDSDIAKLLLLESQNYQADYSRLDNSIMYFLDQNYNVLTDYLPLDRQKSTGKALKTNKRFLKSVIRNVNDHNRQLERNTERSLTPARVTEEDMKTNTQVVTRTSRQIFENNRIRYREKRRRSKSSDADEDDCQIDQNPTEKQRTRTRDKDRHDPSRSKDSDEKNRKHRRHSKSDVPTTASVLEEREDQHTAHPLPTTSKMDKYFAPSYDPRLDVNLDDITDSTTGLIQEKAKEKDRKLEEKLIDAQRKLRKREKKERRKEEKRSRREEDGSDPEEDNLDKERRRRKRREKRKRGEKSHESDRSRSINSPTTPMILMRGAIEDERRNTNRNHPQIQTLLLMETPVGLVLIIIIVLLPTDRRKRA